MPAAPLLCQLVDESVRLTPLSCNVNASLVAPLSRRLVVKSSPLVAVIVIIIHHRRHCHCLCCHRHLHHRCLHCLHLFTNSLIMLPLSCPTPSLVVPSLSPCVGPLLLPLSCGCITAPLSLDEDATPTTMTPLKTTF